MNCTSSSNTIRLKVGDTLRWLCTFDIDGITQDLTNVDIKSDLKVGSEEPFHLVITKKDQTTNRGEFEIFLSNTLTSNFKVGTMSCDIQYVLNGDTISTETFNVSILKQITV